MKCTVEKIEFWSGQVRDEIGGLAKRLQPVVDAGVNFSFVIARRQPDHPGEGHVFFGGIHGPKEAEVARQCGFIQGDMAGLRVEATDDAGTLEWIVSRVAEAGISLRGVTASGAGGRCAIILAFDSTGDRDKAARLFEE
jgi:hypothetical protein